MHKNAFKAAEATRCAQDQGKFWEMHDRLFADQQKIAPEDLVEHAKALGMDDAGFKKCLDEGTYAAAIRKDMAEGQKAGVTGTPTVFLDGNMVKYEATNADGLRRGINVMMERKAVR